MRQHPLVPPPQDPPSGFILLSLPVGGMGLMMVAAMMARDLGGDPGSRLLGRGMALTLGALSMVVFEALIMARPWAFRASLALALTSLIAIAVETDRGAWEMEIAICVAFLGPVLGYLHSRQQAIARNTPAPPPPPQP